MNIRKMMKAMWFLSNARETLINAWVSPQDLQWVDFSDPTSLSKLAAKVMPEILRKNPNFAKQIKESNLLQWKEKEEVIEVVDNL